MNDIKIMSFNVRCICDRGTEAWEERFRHLLPLVLSENPDVIGFQEVTYKQFQDLSLNLPMYNREGKGRDDGLNAGEFAAIFYKKDRFEMLETDSFWLSETPDIPSFGWDAACIRICTYVKLKDLQNGKEFCHFNTHLDHVGQTAMKEGAKLIRANILEKGLPSVATGDFNVNENSEPYNVMTETPLADSKSLADDTMTYGTFHGYNPTPDMPAQSPIDYIFVTEKDFLVKKYRVVVNGKKGEYSSDHYPIIADLYII